VSRPSPRHLLALVSAFVGAGLLLPIRSHFVPSLPALGVSPLLDPLLWAQLVSLAVTALVVAVVVISVPSSRRFLRLGQWNAEVEPVPAIGLKPKPHQTWKHVGLSFALILTVICALVIGTQVGLPSASVVRLIPWILLLSLCNATVEEMISRFGVIGALQDVIGNRSRWVSALLFGVPHYWGSPSGLIGVAMAGFLGWFLAKNVQETGGMGWAILLHTLLDVVVFTALLSQSLD
jgi:membrane protease YdiL (CAAX protease family)